MTAAAAINKLAGALGIDAGDLRAWSNTELSLIKHAAGVGPKNLDKLRLWLARQGTSLLNDAPAELWLEALTDPNAAIPTEFVVLIDHQEKLPYDFASIRCDADRNDRPQLVRTEVVNLGVSHADYTLKNYEGRVAVERKSLDDAQSTFAAYGDRRDAFENELHYLATIECSAVVIECTRSELYGSVQARGRRDERTLAKTLQRSLIAWEQDYCVPFVFCDNRELAEVETFRRLQRFHRSATDIQTIIQGL